MLKKLERNETETIHITDMPKAIGIALFKVDLRNASADPSPFSTAR